MSSRSRALWASVIAAAALVAGCGGGAPLDVNVCHGVHLGDQSKPEIALRGAINRVGYFRTQDRDDICAELGAPESARHESGGRAVWTYGPGTLIYNFKGIGHRVVFKHGAGTVTFVPGREPVMKLGSGGAAAPDRPTGG